MSLFRLAFKVFIKTGARGYKPLDCPVFDNIVAVNNYLRERYHKLSFNQYYRLNKAIFIRFFNYSQDEKDSLSFKIEVSNG